jgi:hypothetical protein
MSTMLQPNNKPDIGTVVSYTVQIHDDIWSDVWTTDDLYLARDYIEMYSEITGKYYRIVKTIKEIL